jgi:galactokinase
MPHGVEVVICDTQVQRALAGSEYAQRRAQCEAGVGFLRKHRPHIKALRDVDAVGLAQYEPDMPPVVARRCRFIVEENARVLEMAIALEAGDKEALRRLTMASSVGARDLYELYVPAMSAMLEAILEAPGSLGGRQAGAGCGGCMVAFVEQEQLQPFIAHVRSAYRRKAGLEPRVFRVHSAGGAQPFEPTAVTS